MDRTAAENSVGMKVSAEQQWEESMIMIMNPWAFFVFMNF